MTEPILAARVRETTGKGAARKMRSNMQIPAVFYGPGSATISLTLDGADLDLFFKENRGENIILDLQVTSDKGMETRKAILKELQLDPVRNSYIHADFYEISMDKAITVDIPIRLLNTPVGVTNGGILQQVRRELNISCLPSALVDTLELDVSELDIGDAVHIRDLNIPEGIELLEEAHLTVAVVAAPTVAAEPEEEEELEEEVEGEEAEKPKETEAETAEES
ncbi:MAG: 50S ribosomal protein L25 [Deltaproteobacteria bacterium]|nr:50S ribosomal protein L25 [Deltaproteobacteria bacterium]